MSEIINSHVTNKCPIVTFAYTNSINRNPKIKTCLKISNYRNYYCHQNSRLIHLSSFVFMFKSDTSLIYLFLLLAFILAIYIDLLLFKVRIC